MGRCAVAYVSQKRMTVSRQLYPDLVMSSGQQLNVNERQIPTGVVLHEPVGEFGHFAPFLLRPDYKGAVFFFKLLEVICQVAVGRGLAVADRQVSFAERPITYLPGEFSRRRPSLGQDHNPGDWTIQPVNQAQIAGAASVPPHGKPVATVVEKAGISGMVRL